MANFPYLPFPAYCPDCGQPIPQGQTCPCFAWQATVAVSCPLNAQRVKQGEQTLGVRCKGCDQANGCPEFCRCTRGVQGTSNDHQGENRG